MVTSVDIDGTNFDTVTVTAGKIAEMDSDTVLLALSYEEDDLLFEDELTVGDLLTGKIDDGDLELTDERVIGFYTETYINLDNV